ncbi:MAG: hypothetical protein AAF437_03365 [Pseudomonadota bacterium]
MSVFHTHTCAAILIVLASIGSQFGFAIGIFGPAWLSPIFSLPAIAAIAWFWRRAEKRNASSQAFARLVI